MKNFEESKQVISETVLYWGRVFFDKSQNNIVPENIGGAMAELIKISYLEDHQKVKKFCEIFAGNILDFYNKRIPVLTLSTSDNGSLFLIRAISLSGFKLDLGVVPNISLTTITDFREGGFWEIRKGIKNQIYPKIL